jgi:hypothetical protein
MLPTRVIRSSRAVILVLLLLGAGTMAQFMLNSRLGALSPGTVAPRVSDAGMEATRTVDTAAPILNGRPRDSRRLFFRGWEVELLAFAWFMVAISLELAAFNAQRPVQQRFRRYLFIGATIAAGAVFWIGWDVAFLRPVAGQYSVGAALILVVFVLSGVSDWSGGAVSTHAMREDANLLFGHASTWVLAALVGAAFTIGPSRPGGNTSGAPMGPDFIAWYDAQPRVSLPHASAPFPVVIVKFVDYQALRVGLRSATTLLCSTAWASDSPGRSSY